MHLRQPPDSRATNFHKRVPKTASHQINVQAFDCSCLVSVSRLAPVPPYPEGMMLVIQETLQCLLARPENATYLVSCQHGSMWQVC